MAPVLVEQLDAGGLDGVLDPVGARAVDADASMVAHVLE
jgi:hypothetical protein